MRDRLATSRLLLLSLLIAAGIGLLVAKQLMDSRAATWQHAESANKNLVFTVSHVLDNSLREIDMALQRTAERQGSAELRQLPPHLHDDVVFSEALPEGTGAELVLDETGTVIHASRALPAGQQAFPQRDYFRAHQQNLVQGLFISRPFRSLVDQQYSVALSRRWSKPDGSFGGVVVITLKLPYLRELFSAIELGPDSGVNLIMTDGTVVLRFPYSDADTGHSLAGTASFERFVRERSGVFMGVAAQDREPRLYAFRALDDYPLLVNTAQSVDSILGAWRRSAIWLGVVTFLLMLACIALALLAARSLRTEHRTARLLHRTQRELRTVLDSLPAMVAYWDRNLLNRFSNMAHMRWFGMSAEQIHGRHIQDVIGMTRFTQVRAHVDLALAGNTQVFEHAVPDSTGARRHVVSTLIPDIGPDGVAGFFVLVTDITDRKMAEEALSAEKERFRVTLEAIGEAVVTTDSQGRITYLNPAASMMTDVPLNQAGGRPIDEVVIVEELDTGEPCASPIHAALAQRRTVTSTTAGVLIARNGRRSDIEASASPIFDARAELMGAVMVFHDVSHARALAHQMTYQAHHDPLTKLPNRRLLRQLANQAIGQATRHDRQVGLLYLDLDGFKRINDSMGHEAGDELLVALSHRLSSTLRPGDTLYRQGGDEFIVLMPGLEDHEEARALARRLIDLCREPVDLGGQIVRLSVSIGMGFFPGDGENFDELMRRADKAMYLAKKQGRDRYCCSDMQQVAGPA
jgi:diguanylate cyclase (GGDEF)-like protein/PAS domain S-box-containing protein